jgi:hypothetical protein
MQTVRRPPEIVAHPSWKGPIVAEPAHKPGFWDIVRRHPLIIAFFVLVGASAGAAAGYSQKPVYTASVPMVVSQVNTTAPGGLTGYASAAPQLADAYSRMATSRSVLTAVGRPLQLGSTEVGSRLTAGPVPGSPVFYLHGNGPDAAAAVRLVNLASAELVRYVRHSNQPVPSPAQVLSDYRNAAQELQGAQNMQDQAKAAYDAARTNANKAALLNARAGTQLARVRATSLENAYTNLTASNLASTNLRVITPADTASSNRRATIEKLVVLGGAAGLVVGMALSWLIGSWTWRRKRA